MPMLNTITRNVTDTDTWLLLKMECGAGAEAGSHVGES